MASNLTKLSHQVVFTASLQRRSEGTRALYTTPLSSSRTTAIYRSGSNANTIIQVLSDCTHHGSQYACPFEGDAGGIYLVEKPLAIRVDDGWQRDVASLTCALNALIEDEEPCTYATYTSKAGLGQQIRIREVAQS